MLQAVLDVLRGNRGQQQNHETAHVQEVQEITSDVEVWPKYSGCASLEGWPEVSHDYAHSKCFTVSNKLSYAAIPRNTAMRDVDTRHAFENCERSIGFTPVTWNHGVTFRTACIQRLDVEVSSDSNSLFS